MTPDESGGSQPQVFEDTDGRLWMVKAPNNPQDGQVLASEFVAAVLGRKLVAAIPPAAVCELSVDLVADVKFADGQPWAAGIGFGSELLPSSPPIYAPGTHEPITNCAAAAAVVAIDTLLGSHDGRQARACKDGVGWAVWAVDFGNSIGPGAWSRASLETLPSPSALEDGHHWLSLATKEIMGELAETLSTITDEDFARIVGAIPAEWGPSDDDRAALVAHLVRRREAVVTLIRQRVGA
jgi:hypothetical protein